MSSIPDHIRKMLEKLPSELAVVFTELVMKINASNERLASLTDENKRLQTEVNRLAFYERNFQNTQDHT